MSEHFPMTEGQKFLYDKVTNPIAGYFSDRGMPGFADFIDPTKDRDKKGGILKKDAEGKTYYEPGTGFPDKFMYGSVPMGTFGSGPFEKQGTTMPIGSFGQNVAQLRTMNGTTDNMGNRSVGDQELAQKENENNKTSMQQNNALNFLKTFAGNTFDKLFDRVLPDNSVEYTFPDGETIKINKDLKERLDNDSLFKQEFDIKKTIPGMKEQPSYNLDGSLRDKSDTSTYPSGLGVGP